MRRFLVGFAFSEQSSILFAIFFIRLRKLTFFFILIFHTQLWFNKYIYIYIYISVLPARHDDDDDIYIYIYIYIYATFQKLTSFHRPRILEILVEITSNFHRMYKNSSWFYFTLFYFIISYFFYLLYFVIHERTVCAYLNENLMKRWIGRGGDDESFLMKIHTVTGPDPVKFLFPACIDELK